MIAIALIIMKLIITYSKGTLAKSPNSPAISVYWSNVFMSVIGALVIIFGNLSLYGVGLGISFIRQSSPRAFTFRITSDIATGILILLELVAAILTPKCTCSVHIPVIITHVLCFNRCCNYCVAENRARNLSRVIQTVALWIQMVLLQLAAASIIPVVAVCLRNPTPSIAFATLMVAIYFCLVIFLAHFIQIMRGGKNSSSKVVFSFLLQSFVCLVFLGIVAGVVIMYLRFVQAGSSTSSVTGIILSLVPTIGISAVSWFAKRQLFSEQKKDDSSEDTKTGIAKYTARFTKFLGNSTKLDTIQQDLHPAPSGEVQSADDAAAAIPTYELEYAESDNSVSDLLM